MDDPQPADLNGGKPERIVLCKSESRGEKERAIVSNAERRFLDALNKLAARVENKRWKARSKIEPAIGRIQARHSRVEKFYTIWLEDGDHRNWDTLKRVMRTHGYTTIVLPTHNGKTHWIRKAGHSEECRKAISHNLGIAWDHPPCNRSVVGPAAKQIVDHERHTTL